MADKVTSKVKKNSIQDILTESADQQNKLVELIDYLQGIKNTQQANKFYVELNEQNSNALIALLLPPENLISKMLNKKEKIQLKQFHMAIDLLMKNDLLLQHKDFNKLLNAWKNPETKFSDSQQKFYGIKFLDLSAAKPSFIGFDRIFPIVAQSTDALKYWLKPPFLVWLKSLLNRFHPVRQVTPDRLLKVLSYKPDFLIEYSKKHRAQLSKAKDRKIILAAIKKKPAVISSLLLKPIGKNNKQNYTDKIYLEETDWRELATELSSNKFAKELLEKAMFSHGFDPEVFFPKTQNEVADNSEQLQQPGSTDESSAVVTALDSHDLKTDIEQDLDSSEEAITALDSHDLKTEIEQDLDSADEDLGEEAGDNPSFYYYSPHKAKTEYLDFSNISNINYEEEQFTEGDLSVLSIGDPHADTQITSLGLEELATDTNRTQESNDSNITDNSAKHPGEQSMFYHREKKYVSEVVSKLASEILSKTEKSIRPL